MIDAKQIEETVLKLSQAIPSGLGEPPAAMKAQLKSILTASLEKMDVVTREEFDIQKAVLAKTRAKLEALEAKIAEWEANK